MAAFSVVIPARFASSRLPGKPLQLIGGKPMIQHVYERALESDAGRVIIATDDERICDAAEGFGASVCMTSPDHTSGTDRLEEVVRLREFAADEIVVNVQGDEPLMPPALINQVARRLTERADNVMATLCEPIGDYGSLFNANVVKVVMDQSGRALYFSRAPIPWARDTLAGTDAPWQQTGPVPGKIPYYRHIGIYAYRVSLLQQFVTWPPAPLEQVESLEQLRVLWNGAAIDVAIAAVDPQPGVDTPEDLERVRTILEGK